MPCRNQFVDELSFTTALRDWFAGRAVESDIAEYRHTWNEERNVWVEKPREVAKYEYADAMLAAREKGRP